MDTMRDEDVRCMRHALAEARLAAEEGEVPVGAVILSKEGRVIGRAHNQKEMLHDPTAHAEMIAITQAAEALGDWRLDGAAVYATIEPCVMCAGALVHARVARLVFGARDPKWGGCGSVFDIAHSERLNHRIEVVEGVLADECAELLRAFFSDRRDG